MEQIIKWINENSKECLDYCRLQNGELENCIGESVVSADELIGFIMGLMPPSDAEGEGV